MKIYCKDCKKGYSVNAKYFNGACPGCGSLNIYDYYAYKIKDVPHCFIDQAHKTFEEKMFCPRCHALLTGLHMSTSCYLDFIDKYAYKLWKKSLKENKKK